MAKIPTPVPIPRWVYFNVTSDNFYDMEGNGKGVGFYQMWNARRKEFPGTAYEAALRACGVDDRLEAAPANTLELLPPAYKLRPRYLLAGYLHLIAACATPAASQLVPPQYSGWGMVATAVLTTYTLFFLGAMNVITYFRKF